MGDEHLAVEVGGFGVLAEFAGVPGVARGDVSERERASVGTSGDASGLARGGVPGVGGAVGGIVRERRVVNQEVGAVRGGDDGVVGARVARVDEFATGAGVADDLLGADDGAVLQFDRVALVELRELRADGDAEFLGLLAVEAALAVVLDERVPDGGRAVGGVERADLVLGAVEDGLARAHLADTDGEADVPADGEHERLYLVAEASGDVNRQGVLAVVEVPRLDESRQPEDVVAVGVRDEHVGDVEAGAVPHHLALGRLAGVEEERVTLPAHEHRAGVAFGRGDGATRPEERSLQSHARTWARRAQNPTDAGAGGPAARALSRTGDVAPHMSRTVATLAVAALLVTAGCTGFFGGDGGEGTVEMYVSDQPGAIEDFQHLNVTITEIAVHPANATENESWVTRDVDNRTVDLTRLEGENASLVGNLSVPSDTYETVFVRIDGIDATLTSGEAADVRLPSERLHLNSEFTVEANETVSFVYDIRVHETGSGRYVLRPNAGESGPHQPINHVHQRHRCGQHNGTCGGNGGMGGGEAGGGSMNGSGGGMSGDGSGMDGGGNATTAA